MEEMIQFAVNNGVGVFCAMLFYKMATEELKLLREAVEKLTEAIGKIGR